MLRDSLNQVLNLLVFCRKLLFKLDDLDVVLLSDSKLHIFFELIKSGSELTKVFFEEAG